MAVQTFMRIRESDFQAWRALSYPGIFVKIPALIVVNLDDLQSLISSEIF